MDHGRYGPPAFTTGDPRLQFHSTVPSLVSDVPFFMHQVLNPNAPLPPSSHTFRDHTTVSPAPPPPPQPTYSPQTGWNPFTGGVVNLNQGTCSYAQGTAIRWPRQETLTLLEIRSRLDHCFREATSSNHKAPLWDEISRIMKEEYGYQRSGRKCKEKFENLYKYYKKTKEGKAGKSDGKNYRFFKQLEALVGDQHDPLMVSINATNTFVYPTSHSNDNHSSGNNDNTCGHYESKNKESMIAAIEESIESHFMKLMVKQEQWCDRILCTIEQKEQERVVIEEEWRKQEVARLDQEYEAWANHVGHIKTRDKSLLEALQNLIKARSVGSGHKNIMDPMVGSNENECLISDHNKCKDWIEPEISRLLVCKQTWDKLCVDLSGRKMECENTISKEVSSGTNNTMNIDCTGSWEPM
ncbi:hypothetical protein R6Q59_019612 [Mikania micrantha]